MTSEALQAVIDAIPANFADPGADYRAVRAMFAGFHGHPTSEDLVIERVDLGGVRCGRYAIAGTPARWTAFHCHGGAFVSTPVDEYDFYAQIIARQTGCSVTMPDYRLAPEHTFPAAHDDCFNAYCGLLESGIEPGSIVVFGESCGGSLALGMLVRLRDAGLPMPAAFISLTGWFDLAVTDTPGSGRDPFLTPRWVRNRGADYLGADAPASEVLRNPLLSPAYAELHNLPPMYLQVGQHDTMREGQIQLGTNALRAGVKVTLESWPGAIHGWHGLVTAQVPEAIAAWRAIRSYIEGMQ